MSLGHIVEDLTQRALAHRTSRLLLSHRAVAQETSPAHNSLDSERLCAGTNVTPNG